tara:strand:- start:930 stop:1373 length:444 start_codon:yes stop_codon:yes gene_type:complete
MKKRFGLITVYLLTFEFLLASNALDKLSSAKTLKCEFAGGMSIALDPGSDWTVENTSLPPTIIDNIDFDVGTARLIGNAGSADLAVIKFAYGLVFIEHGLSYFHTITTPYKTMPDNPIYYPVFYNRHVSFGSEVNSNLYGKCQIHSY